MPKTIRHRRTRERRSLTGVSEPSVWFSGTEPSAEDADAHRHFFLNLLELPALQSFRLEPAETAGAQGVFLHEK